MKYRSDIDGLRALAVVPVVLFHVGGLGPIARGGFVGVDIFFVISGYLITKIIFENVSHGTYSVAGFYVRRARRILPAAIPVYLFCILMAALFLFPSERRSVVQAAVSSIGFASNIFFYGSAGYFDEASKTNPLLHTWSLSVEEQFYVFLPILIFLLRKASLPTMKIAIVGFAAASFIVACVGLAAHPDAVFYLLPYRAWELLAGSILALGVVPPLSRRISAEVAAGAGLLLIAGSVQYLTSESAFPGWNALPACLGATLIIHAGASHRETMTARLLSLWPLRFTGLISYSLYLWHWPLIVFYPELFASASLLAKGSIVAASFTLAFLSWRFVERPFRLPPGVQDSNARVLGTSGIALAATALLAIVMLPIAKLVRPTDPGAERLMAQTVAPVREQRLGTCFLTSTSKDFTAYEKTRCLGGDPAKRDILLMGDSHAAQYYPGLATAMPDTNILQATASGCRPLGNYAGTPRCTAMMNYITDTFLPTHKVDTLILAARWRDGDGPRLEATLRRLRPFARQIVVLGPIVEYSQPLPRVLALAWPQEDARKIASYRIPAIPGTDREISYATTKVGARFISVYRMLCPNDCTVLSPDGKPMQFDYGHLSLAGSRYVADRLRPLLG